MSFTPETDDRRRESDGHYASSIVIDKSPSGSGDGGLGAPAQGLFAGTIGNKKNVVGLKSGIMLVACQHLRQVHRNFFASVRRRRVFPNDHGFLLGGGGLQILGQAPAPE